MSVLNCWDSPNTCNAFYGNSFQGRAKLDFTGIISQISVSATLAFTACQTNVSGNRMSIVTVELCVNNRAHQQQRAELQQYEQK